MMNPRRAAVLDRSTYRFGCRHTTIDALWIKSRTRRSVWKRVTPLYGVHVAPPSALLKAALFGFALDPFYDVVSHNRAGRARDEGVAAAIDRDAGGVILLGAADRQAEHDVGGRPDSA